MATARLASSTVTSLLAGLDQPFATLHSQTLVKTDHLEVARLVLPAGRHIAAHQVNGELTLHCLHGCVALELDEQTLRLQSGDLVFLAGHVRHGMLAQRDSLLLLSLVLRSKNGAMHADK